MVLSDVAITQFLGQYFWVLTRLTAFFLAAPFFGTQIISARVRLVLAFSISVLVAPLIPTPPALPALSLPTLLITAQQVIIGLTLGFFFQVMFQLFVLAGQYIAMKMGLGFAQMNDPSNGVSVTIVSQFYLLMITLMFLAMNGHLVLIEMLVESFLTLPIGYNGFTADDFYTLIEAGSWMFGSALTIALPLLTSLLITNIAFGIISRSAPQINIFAVGFPFTLVFGLFLIWVSLTDFIYVFDNFVRQGFQFAENIIGG